MIRLEEMEMQIRQSLPPDLHLHVLPAISLSVRFT